MKIYVASTGYIDQYNSQDYCVVGYFRSKEDALNHLDNTTPYYFDEIESFHDRNVWWWQIRDEDNTPIVVAMISEEKVL